MIIILSWKAVGDIVCKGIVFNFVPPTTPWKWIQAGVLFHENNKLHSFILIFLLFMTNNLSKLPFDAFRLW